LKKDDLFWAFGTGNRYYVADPCPKCGGEKLHKGRKPDYGFAKSKHREALKIAAQVAS